MKKYPNQTHVKHDLLFRVPLKRLAKLPAVIQNWLQTHEYFDFTFGPNITGKKLLFVLYYALRSREFDLRNKEEYIASLIDRHNQLQSDYNTLQDELKGYKYASYTFNCIRVEWDCGDGCCSDSWHEYQVLDESNNIIDSGGDKYWSESYVYEILRNKYGSKIYINNYQRNSDSQDLFENY